MDKLEAELIADLKRARIGDDEGRRLFVMSLRLRLGTLSPEVPMVEPSAAAPTYDPDLYEVGQLARALGARVGGLSEAAREVLLGQLTDHDAFARKYTGEFLTSFDRLLKLVEHACTQLDPAPVQPGSPDPQFMDEFRNIVAQTYRQAFDDDSAEGVEQVLAVLARRMKLPISPVG
ncbi:MAG: hypothetical protein KDG50_07400 [Chromatiales bacterium]|nr:hypothetical protein [Chromatiales bacterium]